MDPEVKAQWVEALRSGKYRQGNSVLARYDHRQKRYNYCCLGVLCNLDTNVQRRRDPGTKIAVYYDTVEPHLASGYDCYLPDTMRERVGLTHQTMIDLAVMNDGDMSFSEIADWIEREL